MRWVVLPLTATDIRAIATLNVVYTVATANVGIAIEVVVDVDVDIAASPTTAPTPTTAPRGSHGHTDAEGNCTGGNDRSRRWWVVNRRIWICGRTIDNSRVVRRNVNNLRIRLLDHDHFFALNGLGHNFLLLVGGQCTTVLGLVAHPLNRIHHIFLLRQECIAKIGGPLDVISQALYDVGHRGHRLDTRIPRLFLNSFG